MFVVSSDHAHFMVNGLPISMKKKRLSETRYEWTVRDDKTFRLKFSVHKDKENYILSWKWNVTRMKVSVETDPYIILRFYCKACKALFESDMSFINPEYGPCNSKSCPCVQSEGNELAEFDPEESQWV